jgi:hypothetical protein
MSDQFVGTPDPAGASAPLAQWLYQLLAESPQATSAEKFSPGEDASPLSQDYHLAFYPQIPNFAQALLQQDSAVWTRYANLLFHLMSCPVCHRAYLEIYDALRVAQNDTLHTTSALRTPTPSSFGTTTPKMLVFLCQLLIGQARSVLLLAHREQTDQDAWARSLLQQAMQISRLIMQGTLRQRALRDLVEVAGLYSATGPAAQAAPPGPAALSYVSLVSNASGTRGRPVMRRAEMMAPPPQQASIELRSASLEGTVTQQGEQLILQLVDLDKTLRGHFLLISIPLGTLLEPVRWQGGNPYAIRSTVPVGPDGVLVTPLGKTDLQLTSAEDRNLLETLFKKLDIRATA